MITVVGEALVDVIDEVAHPGGSPANVAVALARLGHPVDLLTQVGDDRYGRLLRAHLRDNGVDLAPGSFVDAARTSTARATLGPDGHASYAFDISWQRLPGLAAGWPDPAVTCVHTGSLATMLAPGADDVVAAARAARRATMVSFDPNCRPSLVADRCAARDRVTTLVATSDVVKASVEDLAWLYPGRPYRDVAGEWLALGASLVAVTLGGDGAWARARHREAAVDAYPIEVVDTVGAGDAFMAGLLCALGRADLLGAPRRAALGAIDEAALTEVLAFASRVAAATCARRGADPPTRHDLPPP